MKLLRYTDIISYIFIVANTITFVAYKLTGDSALHLAAVCSALDTAQLLVKAGININIKNKVYPYIYGKRKAHLLVRMASHLLGAQPNMKILISCHFLTLREYRKK